MPHWMLWWKLTFLLERKRATSTVHRSVSWSADWHKHGLHTAFYGPEKALSGVCNLFRKLPQSKSKVKILKLWDQRLVDWLGGQIRIFFCDSQSFCTDLNVIIPTASFWGLPVVEISKSVLSFSLQLSDKDLAYLEERIKRSSKNRPNTAPANENTAKTSVSARGGSDSSANGGKKREEKRPGKAQMAR